MWASYGDLWAKGDHLIKTYLRAHLFGNHYHKWMPTLPSDSGQDLLTLRAHIVPLYLSSLSICDGRGVSVLFRVCEGFVSVMGRSWCPQWWWQLSTAHFSSPLTYVVVLAKQRSLLWPGVLGTKERYGQPLVVLHVWHESCSEGRMTLKTPTTTMMTPVRVCKVRLGWWG